MATLVQQLELARDMKFGEIPNDVVESIINDVIAKREEDDDDEKDSADVAAFNSSI